MVNPKSLMRKNARTLKPKGLECNSEQSAINVYYVQKISQGPSEIVVTSYSECFQTHNPTSDCTGFSELQKVQHFQNFTNYYLNYQLK